MMDAGLHESCLDLEELVLAWKSVFIVMARSQRGCGAAGLNLRRFTIVLMNERTSIEGVVDAQMVLIPAGWFLMGSERGQDVERPIHRVWVDLFLLSPNQVTVEQYARFLDAKATPAPPFWSDADFNRAKQPVVGVSWFAACAYCEWLSSRSALHFRLPTEAEWERAARGGMEGALFPWGDEPPESRAGYRSRWKTGPEDVAQSEPNAYGLFEMCENVHEWCSDWFDAAYYLGSPERNPQGPAMGNRKSSRGGSWRHQIKISRCSARSSIPPDFEYADYGFRVAADPAGGEAARETSQDQNTN